MPPRKLLNQPRGALHRLVARIRALLAVDWRGRSGEIFRSTTATISGIAEKRMTSAEGGLADEMIKLGVTKLEGLANKEFAAAVKDFAEAERTRIGAELERRSLKSRVEKEEEEARLTKIRRLDAELELIKKMKELSVIFRRDEEGNLTVLPAPKGFDFHELVEGVRGGSEGREEQVEGRQGRIERRGQQAKLKKTILCVDDNEQSLSIRKIMLETRGYRVVACTSGNAALEAFRAGGIDLVLSDLIMPDLAGDRLIAKIKEMSPGTPTILFSGKIRAYERDTEADVFLPKGMYSPPELLERIRLLLLRKQRPKRR